MKRGNRCLHRERPWPAAQRLLNKGERFGYLLPIPLIAILLFQSDEIAVLV